MEVLYIGYINSLKKRGLCFVSPYSFEGSVLDFDKIFQWAIENKIAVLVLSDTTLHGVVKFIRVSKKYKDIIPVIGYRKHDKTYVFRNTSEFIEFLKIYNSRDLNEHNSKILEQRFTYIKSKPIYFLPGQEEIYKILCDYMGKKIEIDDIENFDINKHIFEIDESQFNIQEYSFKSSQKLPISSDDFLEELLNQEKEYKERLEREIRLVKSFKFEDYFYTVKRIVEIAKAHNIEVGYGRGSAVGSLLAYRLGITKIDPVKYNLLFERFLNEGRTDYPDIDLDIEDVRRQELIKLLKSEFGYVYNISTFVGIPKKFLDSIPEEYANELSNIPIQRSTHAAGVIISTTPLNVPMIHSESGIDTIEWDMDDLQYLGYIKFDLLGLKTLSIYKELRDTISQSFKEEKEEFKKNTYRYISVGFTDNVFQLESSIGKSVVRDVKPSNISELAITISLNRPGPLRSGITGEIRNLKLKKLKKYNLEILDETYGLPIYQEQIMKIAMELAGFSSTQADILRKAIAKKDIDSIRQLYERLKNALFGKLGKEGLELAKNILAFGEYAFNKSHAIAYSHLTYYMAYFKVNFPDIFYDTYLKYDTSILQDALYNLQTLNYKVLPPKLFSNLKTMNKDEKIYHLPLHILPGISVEKSKQLQTMEFKSFEDFVEKADLPLSVIEALIKVGAFDDIFESRRKAIQKLRNLRNKFNQEAVKIGNKLFGKIVKVDETKVEEDWERTNMEYDILGIAVSLPTKVTNNLAPYCIAYSLDLPYAVHVSVKAGYGTDGKSVFKVNLPDGNYTLVYPNRFEPGHMKVSYEVKTIPTRAEISKLSTQGFEQIILPSGKVLQNSRPIMNGIRTVLRDK